MSRVNSKLANGSEALVPSSYSLVSVILTTHDGLARNITDLCAQISIRESIYAGSLQGQINILDAARSGDHYMPKAADCWSVGVTTPSPLSTNLCTVLT